MREPRTTHERVERLIDWLDKPLLALAVLTMVIYLLDLMGGIEGGHPVWLGLTFTIDSLFVIDLVLKVWAFGATYLQSPWFLIDLISCLPLLDAISTGVHPLRAARFVRGFRILRILRGLRILRALRSIPAFEQFLEDSPASRSEKRLHRSMNVALVAMTLLVLVLIVCVRRTMEAKFMSHVDGEIKTGLSRERLEELGGSVQPPGPPDEYISREAVVDGVPRTVYFDEEQVERESDAFEFWLIVGMMISMLFLMYIIAYHQIGQTQTQLRGLLNLALPKQVVDRLVVDPTAYTFKSRSPATIMFIDFVGFTEICEQISSDPDLLSKHLEAAMDRLVGELVRHDLIIDKFIGDAIMSFRGGPLVSGGLEDHAYRAVRAALDSVKALAALDDPYFNRVKIGGASANDCLIGAFGTSVRFSYTILGDAVNLAARLEPASAQCKTQNLFCEQTYRLCAQRPDLIWRRWGWIRVVGKSAALNVYEAFDANDLGDPTFLSTFQRALDAFERCDFDRARDLFLQANSQRERGDPPSRDYARLCEPLILGGPPPGWEPVFNCHK